MLNLLADHVRAFRSLVIATALGLLLASEAKGQCAFTSLDAVSFGEGAGVCSTATLLGSLDTNTCSIEFSYAVDEFHCGNTYFTQQLLILGLAAFPNGAGVGSGFIPGSRLYVLPLVVIGPLPGGPTTLPLPNDAALLGITFFAQTAPSWLTTISPPFKPETGLSSALALTLH